MCVCQRHTQQIFIACKVFYFISLQFIRLKLSQFINYDCISTVLAMKWSVHYLQYRWIQLKFFWSSGNTTWPWLGSCWFESSLSDIFLTTGITFSNRYDFFCFILPSNGVKNKFFLFLFFGVNLEFVCLITLLLALCFWYYFDTMSILLLFIYVVQVSWNNPSYFIFN